MRAHLLGENGWIINTVLVPDLNFIPNLIDAAIGGQIGDRVVDGQLVLVATQPPAPPDPVEPPAEPAPDPEPAPSAP